ncbi:MAG: hypothetical protein R2828_11645 [Saprospiraceae bacterium]
MILKLRKRHRLMWLALALVLPLSYIVALKARPTPIGTSATSINALNTTLLKELVNLPTLKAWFSKDESNKYYLELNLTLATTHSLALFYLADAPDADVNSGRLLGAVGAQGHQRFVVDSLVFAQSPAYLLQYDPLRKEKIDAIELQTK